MIQLTDTEHAELVRGMVEGDMPSAVIKVISARQIDVARVIQVALRQEGADRYARKTMPLLDDIIHVGLDAFEPDIEKEANGAQ